MAPTPPKQSEADARMTRADRDEQHRDDRPGEGRQFGARDWEQANAPTDPEQRRAFRDRWAQSHLPNLPKKEGWHRCWVSTKHPTDTPERRIALGYKFVDRDDVKNAGWAPDREVVKDGSGLGAAVCWREMVAMEQPMEDYIAYMREFHHDAPRDMVSDIYGQLQELNSEAKDRGARIDISEGFKELVRYTRAPTQFEG